MTQTRELTPSTGNTEKTEKTYKTERIEEKKPEARNAPTKGGLFSRIIVGKEQKPRRVLLYGTQGIGKSSWASMAPKPIFIPTEDGLADIDAAKFPLIREYEQMILALSDLYTEKHDFKTVVIDSIDWLEQIIWRRLCDQHDESSIEGVTKGSKFAFGRGYTLALTFWRGIVEGLDALRNDKGMQVILISHAKIEQYRSPDTETYDRYMPRVHKSVSALLCEWADEVLFAAWDVLVKTIKEGFNQERKQGVGTGERILHTVERPSAQAKNRLNLPAEMPLDYREYAKFVNGKQD